MTATTNTTTPPATTNTDTAPAPLDLYVVPCGAAKLDHPAPARDLYTGPHFRYVLAGVERETAEAQTQLGVESHTLILSARHGLITPDTVLAPYDVTMTDPDAVTAEQLADQLRPLAARRKVEIYAFLPGAYHQRLRAAADLLMFDIEIGADLWPVLVHDVYEAAPGIGHHRHVIACTGHATA